MVAALTFMGGRLIAWPHSPKRIEMILEEVWADLEALESDPAWFERVKERVEAASGPECWTIFVRSHWKAEMVAWGQEAKSPCTGVKPDFTAPS